MTREEAIKRLNLRSVDAAGEAARGNVEALKDLEAYGLAIEALEKQIPKGVFMQSDGYANGCEVWDFECTNCGFSFTEYIDSGYLPVFCPDCGQAIDWSEEK